MNWLMTYVLFIFFSGRWQHLLMRADRWTNPWYRGFALAAKYTTWPKSCSAPGICQLIRHEFRFTAKLIVRAQNIRIMKFDTKSADWNSIKFSLQVEANVLNATVNFFILKSSLRCVTDTERAVTSSVTNGTDQSSDNCSRPLLTTSWCVRYVSF